jgi:TonB family protein
MNRVVAASVVGFCLSLPLHAQDSLQAAKDLYASAAYEDALAVLGRINDAKPEVEQYRVFCLVALGRTNEAEKAIEAVVAANPMYLPDPAETSPRVNELFAKTRRQLLPDVARRMYADAKAALDRKDRDGAIDRFSALVTLIDGAGAGAEGTLGELRLLASGFLDLSRALPEPAPEPPAASVAPASAAISRTPEIVRPIAIKQEYPRWVPVDTVSRQSEFTGAVRVRITAAGTVESAELLRSIHPSYDRRLLEAARGWLYQPATQNGVAVPSEHIVEVRLRPR